MIAATTTPPPGEVQHLSGGTGIDFVLASTGADDVTLGAGDDGALLRDGDDIVAPGKGRDTLISIENVIGSSRGDRIKGNGEANRLDGGADMLDGKGGDDWLKGVPGDDTLIGGCGRDTADYAGYNGKIIVNLSKTVAQVTGPARPSLQAMSLAMDWRTIKSSFAAFTPCTDRISFNGKLNRQAKICGSLGATAESKTQGITIQAGDARLTSPQDGAIQPRRS